MLNQQISQVIAQELNVCDVSAALFQRQVKRNVSN